MPERNQNAQNQNAQTPSQLRRDIDTGKGRDKVDHPDPAAAPLGTDDEAAGTPVTQEQMELARQHEIRDRAKPDKKRPD